MIVSKVRATLGGGAVAAPREYAFYRLPAMSDPIPLPDDGITYVKVPGMELAKGLGFTETSGTLNKVSTDGEFLFSGSADVALNKAARLTFSLFMDGVLVPGAQTPHDFTSASKVSGISITAFIDVPAGSALEVRAKGDGTLSTELVVNTLNVTLLQR